jgi:hypothetical protein
MGCVASYVWVVRKVKDYGERGSLGQGIHPEPGARPSDKSDKVVALPAVRRLGLRIYAGLLPAALE